MHRWALGIVLIAPIAAARGQEPQRVTPVVRVVRRAGPSVINISTQRIVEVRQFRAMFPFPEDFFEPGFRPFGRGETRTEERQWSLGSGVIVDADRALAVTNEHVIRQADRVTARLADGRSFACRVVAVDARRDLALLRLMEAAELQAATLAADDTLHVGEAAIAIGNPFGLENTVTTGVISARRRTIERRDAPPFRNLIQTDCAINPGSSGGPLLAIDGTIIGINTAIRQDAEGIGFAVPAGEVRALIGVTFPGPGDFPVLGFGVDEGARVAWVRSDSPAETARLAVGDVILSAGRANVARLGVGTLRPGLQGAAEGGRAGISVRRDEETVALEMDLSTLAANEPVAFRGMKVVAVTPVLAARFGLDVTGGVVVEEVEEASPAHRIGIRAGDRLLSFGRFRVETLADLRRVTALAADRALSLLVYLVRGDDRMMGRLPPE